MDLTHIISILNSVFTIVFYPMRWIKVDHNYICFEDFLNQLNLLYKYKMSIYACLMTRKKPSEKLKISDCNLLSNMDIIWLQDW
jgi:hypothetical protein